MKTGHTDIRELFWAQPLALPDGLALERSEPIVITRPGRGGVAIYDVAELVTPSGRLSLLLGYQSRLLAGQVEKLHDKIASLANQRRERLVADGRQRPAGEIVPVIVTDVAKPSVIEACRRAGLGVLDQRGTIVLHAGPVFVFVEGKGQVERPWRGRLFSGKASRIIRFLLTKAAFETLTVPRTAQTIASACELSYVYAHGVLTSLEREGFVERPSPRGGFHLKDPLGLLRAWIASGEHTALATEGFYAPATTRAALIEGAKRLKDSTGGIPVFSLASALDPDEVHVAGLPHGVYWTGELSDLVDAFGLRRTTPHNFLVLRPDPIVWTDAGGLLLVEPQRSDLSDGVLRVSLAQLAADFASIPGRGREQSDYLLGVYAKKLPYHLDER